MFQLICTSQANYVRLGSKLFLTNRNLLAGSKDKALFSYSNRLKPLILSRTDSPNHETYSKLTKSSQFWNCGHHCCEISNPIVVKVSLKDRMKNTTVVSTKEIDVKFRVWDDLDLPKSTLFKDRTDRVSLITTAGKAPSSSHAFCYLLSQSNLETKIERFDTFIVYF